MAVSALRCVMQVKTGAPEAVATVGAATAAEAAVTAAAAGGM